MMWNYKSIPVYKRPAHFQLKINLKKNPDSRAKMGLFPRVYVLCFFISLVEGITRWRIYLICIHLGNWDDRKCFLGNEQNLERQYSTRVRSIWNIRYCPTQYETLFSFIITTMSSTNVWTVKVGQTYIIHS